MPSSWAPPRPGSRPWRSSWLAATRAGSSCRPTRCRCTAGWTSAPPSPALPRGPRSRTTCSTSWSRGRTARSPGSRAKRVPPSPTSNGAPGLDAHPPTELTLVGLRREPHDLRARIDARYQQQMAAGFLDEVRRLREHPRGISRTAGQALGYKELLEHLDGTLTLDEAVDLAIRRTGRFARRQWAWFRRDPRIRWLEAPADGPGNLLVDALGAAVGS